MHTLPLLTDIAYFLDAALDAAQFEDDQHGIFVPSERAVWRIGLALEPWPDLHDWAQRAQLDAIFLHRPWQLQPGQLPDGVGVLAYHLAFDERLTLGWNQRLATALGMTQLEVLGRRENRQLGMLGVVPTESLDAWQRRLCAVFGNYDEIRTGEVKDMERIAVVGAMNDVLVREAWQRGAQLYVTGQFRQSAAHVVADTGIAVAAIGHRRSEAWGLRALAGLLRERWAALEIVLISS